jgi:hypothetical protein
VTGKGNKGMHTLEIRRENSEGNPCVENVAQILGILRSKNEALKKSPLWSPICFVRNLTTQF